MRVILNDRRSNRWVDSALDDLEQLGISVWMKIIVKAFEQFFYLDGKSEANSQCTRPDSLPQDSHRP